MIVSSFDRCENIFSGIQDRSWNVQTTEQMASAVADGLDWSRNISRDDFLQTSYILEDVSPLLDDCPVNYNMPRRNLRPILSTSVTTVGSTKMNTLELIFSFIDSITSILSFISELFLH